MVQLALQQALAFLAIDHLGADLQRVDHVDAAIDIRIAVDRFISGLPRTGERLDQQFADFQFTVTHLIHNRNPSLNHNIK